MSNIIELIMQDHRDVDALFDRITQVTETDEKQSLFRAIATELSAHAEAEERILYPAMKRAMPEEIDEVDHAKEEHDEVKSLIQELLTSSPSAADFDTKIQKLIGDVRHHVEEEETRTLPDFRGRVDQAELQELGRQFLETKADLGDQSPLMDLTRKS